MNLLETIFFLEYVSLKNGGSIIDVRVDKLWVVHLIKLIISLDWNSVSHVHIVRLKLDIYFSLHKRLLSEFLPSIPNLSRIRAHLA